MSSADIDGFRSRHAGLHLCIGDMRSELVMCDTTRLCDTLRALAATVPTDDEIESTAANIAASGYSSEAVDVFERWTRDKFGVVGTESHLRKSRADLA